MASRPFQFWEKKRSKIKTRAAKHFAGLERLVHPFSGAAVKAGCKPVHFSLDGCTLSATFPGVWPQLRGHFVHKSERRTKDGGLSYTPCLLMKTDLRLRLHATQAQPCFPAASNAPCPPRGNGIFTATPTERITHYTLLRKVVCQMGALPPLETPTKKRRYATPLRGAYRLFLLSSPPAVSVEQKSAWD